MNDSTRVMRRPRRAWPPAARAAAAIIATAALALLAAACGGSPSSTGPGGSSNAGGPASSQAAVAYARCMRSHGVPDFPDPDSSRGAGAQGHPAASSGSAIPSSRRPSEPAHSCSSTAASDPGPAQQIMTGHAEFRPVHALPRHTELARPHLPIAVGSLFSTLPGIDPDSPQIDSKHGRATALHLLVPVAATDGQPTTIQLHATAPSDEGTEMDGETVRAAGRPAQAEILRSRRLGDRAAVAAGRPWASWPWWRPGRCRRGGPGCSPRPPPPGPGRGRPPPATAAVTRQDIAATTPVTATLGYAGSYLVRGQGGGTLTWLPPAGQVIRQGHALYRDG